MRSLPVVVLHLGRDLDAGIGQAHEQHLREQFVLNVAVEARGITIPHRPPGRNLPLLYADFAAPCTHPIADNHLSPVTYDYAVEAR